MSHSRSAKYIEKGTPEQEMVHIEEKISVEKALVGTVLTTPQIFISDDVIPDLVYPAAALKNLIYTNGYAKLCVNKRAESTVGKGWNEIEDTEKNLFATDQWIIDNIKTEELIKAEKNALTYGRYFLEIPYLNGLPLTVYSVPVSTMLKGANAKAGQFCQYYGIKGKEKWFPEFDFERHKKGTLPNGTYMYMWKNEDEVYGIPEWIAFQMEMLTSKEQRRTILSFYLNNADPDKFIVHYATDLSNKMGEDYKAKRKQFTQGSEKRGSTDHIFRRETAAELGKAIEVIEVDKEILTAVTNQFIFANKLDICAAFQVPAFMVNLKSINGSSSMGGSNEETQFAFYISETIQPTQRQRYYEPFKMFWPDMKMQLNTSQMPKTINEKNADNTIDKSDVGLVKKAFDVNAALKELELKI
ncbi:MAG TPA: hypothetical protein PLM72_07415 [Spirochaetota bacterium]|nr:hypothetical protein [Spirochaetota bacterium]